MKKILFITNISNGVNSFSIASLMAAKDCKLEFHLAGNFKNTNNKKIREDEKKYNVKLHQIDLSRSPFEMKNIKAYKQLKNLIKEEGIDYIHCNTPIGGILGRLAGNKYKVKKVIYTAHGFHFYKGAPLINRTLFKWAEMLMAHWTDAIIVMNEEDYYAALKFRLKNGGKVYHIPGVGIDTKKYKDVSVNRTELKKELGLKDNDIVCISMGDLVPNKNYKASIEAIVKCPSNIHYLICGRGQELKNLKQLVKDKEVEDRIHFLGFRTDVKELLKISDIFLFTTLREGMPRSMMEAMASGLPCIASKIRGNVDLLKNEKGGFLIEVNDINGFANCIEMLYNDGDLRRRMGKYNLESIKEYDVSIVKNKIQDIYKEVLYK